MGCGFELPVDDYPHLDPLAVANCPRGESRVLIRHVIFAMNFAALAPRSRGSVRLSRLQPAVVINHITSHLLTCPTSDSFVSV